MTVPSVLRERTEVRTVFLPNGHTAQVKPGEHLTIQNHNAEPVCACGWVPRAAQTLTEAIRLVHEHVAESRTPDPDPPAGYSVPPAGGAFLRGGMPLLEVVAPDGTRGLLALSGGAAAWFTRAGTSPYDPDQRVVIDPFACTVTGGDPVALAAATAWAANTAQHLAGYPTAIAAQRLAWVAQVALLAAVAQPAPQAAR